MIHTCCYWTSQRPHLIHPWPKTSVRKFASSLYRGQEAYSGLPIICTRLKRFATACCFCRGGRYCWKGTLRLCRRNTAKLLWKHSSLRLLVSRSRSGIHNQCFSFVRQPSLFAISISSGGASRGLCHCSPG